ncbi:hypothetical protein GCM10018954_087420 [Kutzneria kofuensis]
MVFGEGEPEAAHEESPFGGAEFPFVVTEAVDVAVAAEVLLDGAHGGDAARVVGGQRTAQCRQQQGSIDRIVVYGSLPVATRMQGSPGGLGQDGIGQGRAPVRHHELGGASKAGHADQVGMGPGPVLQFPHAGLVLRHCCSMASMATSMARSASRRQVVVLGGRAEQQQRLAEGVQLELVPHAVADPVGAAGIAGKVEFTLVGDLPAGDGVRRLEVGPVLDQPFATKRTASSMRRCG